MNNKRSNTPLLLAILDGWGIGKPSRGNAITLGKTPNYDKWWRHYSHTKLFTSGQYVGLPRAQFGNSEAGHLNLGAGRVVKQDSVRISDAIKDGRFAKNPAFLTGLQHLQKYKGRAHVMGLLSGSESAHAERGHLLAVLQLLADHKIREVYLHLFTDGRDAPQHDAIKFVREVQKGFCNGERIVSIVGRYYAMDRNKRWGNTERAYELLTRGKGYWAPNPEEAIMQAYNRKETDEFIEPTSIRPKESDKPIVIKDNDIIIFYNLRSDRARQLAKTFVQSDFNKSNPGSFIRKPVLSNIKFIAMTDFGPDLDEIITAFPSEDLKETLPMMLKDLRQLYIAESEKFAHVTYFFNGGYANPVNNEKRSLIPSPHLKSYADKPAMSINHLADTLLSNIKEDKFDFYCVNFANPDMIGHTGDLEAAIQAVEVVDEVIGKIQSALAAVGGTMIITADHGNIEEMIDLKTGEVNTEHTDNPVPFIIINEHKYRLRRGGSLANVAPTILDLLDLPKSKLMTKSLLK